MNFPFFVGNIVIMYVNYRPHFSVFSLTVLVVSFVQSIDVSIHVTSDDKVCNFRILSINDLELYIKSLNENFVASVSAA